MKIDGPPKIRGTSSVTPTSKTGVATTGASTGVNPIEDTVTIMGIPSSEMTPKVHTAIMTFLAEVDTLRQDLALAHRRIDELERLVDLDPLVPVSNRRAFVREVSRAVSFAERYGTKSTLIFFDVNNMKTINDTFGHAAGDKALMHVAESFSEGVRDLDVVGRLGGDEFGVLLAQIGEDAALKKAQDLINRVENTPITWDGVEMNVYLAHGGYSFCPGQAPAEALAEADRKMYENKRARKAEQ